MKKTIYFFIFICLIGISTIKAQGTGYPVATLEHNGTTTVYYGSEAFISAYDYANNGDTIYLSADNFRSYRGIYKTLHVYGAGSSDPYTAGTYFNTDWLYFYGSSDSSTFEGIYMMGIVFQTNSNGIHLRKCRIGNLQFQSGSPSVLIDNNIIYYANFNWTAGQNVKVRNNLFVSNNWWQALTDGAYNILFEHNTFYGGYYFMNTVNNCYFRNNIFYTYNTFTWSLNNFTYANNVFERNIINENSNSSFNFGDTTTYGTNVFLGNYYSYNGNYLNTLLPNWGTIIDANSDLTLISPQTYPGTDSTQVGMYGGVNPIKQFIRPSNPYIVSKTIPFITNINGTLPVNIKAKAQNY